MNSNKKYTGVIVPAVTPLNSNYKLDEGAAEKMFNYFYQYNISPFILGTTGESASLPLQVKQDYVKKAVVIKKNNSVLYSGISSNCLQESIDFANFCFDNGVDAVAATLPSYFALSESQMKQYFIDLADAVTGIHWRYGKIARTLAIFLAGQVNQPIRY